MSPTAVADASTPVKPQAAAQASPAKPAATDAPSQDAEEEDEVCQLPTREEAEAIRAESMKEPLEELLPGVEPDAIVKVTLMTARKNLDDNHHFSWDVRAAIADMEIIGKRDITCSSWRGWNTERIVVEVLDVPKGTGLKDIKL